MNLKQNGGTITRKSTRSNIGKPPQKQVQVTQEKEHNKTRGIKKKTHKGTNKRSSPKRSSPKRSGKRSSPKRSSSKRSGKRSSPKRSKSAEYKNPFKAPRPPALANAMNLNPYLYNKQAASFANYRGNFNPNMDPATAESNAIYHKQMAEYHAQQAAILDQMTIKM